MEQEAGIHPEHTRSHQVILSCITLFSTSHTVYLQKKAPETLQNGKEGYFKETFPTENNEIYSALRAWRISFVHHRLKPRPRSRYRQGIPGIPARLCPQVHLHTTIHDKASRQTKISTETFVRRLRKSVRKFGGRPR
jgi:hypothetical protein